MFTECIDSASTVPILVSRLIPLDKGNCEVRLIGVGNVIRRIIARCVIQVTKQDILKSSGSLQICAGHKSGSHVAAHAMNSLFQNEETVAVLLTDASNALDTLTRATALHNIRALSPMLATFAINTYRTPTRLFAIEGILLKTTNTEPRRVIILELDVIFITKDTVFSLQFVI